MDLYFWQHHHKTLAKKRQLRLIVGVTDDTRKKFPKQLQNVTGDTIFSSTNPNWKTLEPRVVSMTVRLD